MKWLDRYTYWIFSFLLLALAGLLYAVSAQRTVVARTTAFGQVVQQQVWSEGEALMAGQQLLTRQIAQTNPQTFSDFQRLGVASPGVATPGRFSYVVYSLARPAVDGPGVARPGVARPVLIYWSDHRLIPPPDRFLPTSGVATAPADRPGVATPGPTLVSLPQGLFLLHRTALPRGRDTLLIGGLLALTQNGQVNRLLFPATPPRISRQPLPGAPAIVDKSGRFLFAAAVPSVAYQPLGLVLALGLVLVVLGVVVQRQLRGWQANRQYELGFGLTALYLLLCRAVLLYVAMPYQLTGWALFEPKADAPLLTPSPGDRLLHLLFGIALLGYLVRYYFRSRTYRRLVRLPVRLKQGLSVLLVVAGYVAFFGYLLLLTSLFSEAADPLDINLSLAFPADKLNALLVFVVGSVAYFLLIHLLSSLFCRLNPVLRPGLLWLAVGTLLSSLLLLLPGRPAGLLLLANGLFMSVLYVSRFPRSLYALQYRTAIYLVLGALVCALAAALVGYRQEDARDRARREAVATQRLAQNDPRTELMLRQINRQIQADSILRRIVDTDTLLARERAQQRISSTFLTEVLSRYDVDVSLFRAGGKPLDNRPEAVPYAALVTQYARPAYETNVPGTFFINDTENGFARQYVSFLPIRRPDSSVAGYVTLNLRLRPEPAAPPAGGSDDGPQPTGREISYALYSPDGRLLQRNGTLNFERRLPTKRLNDPLLYESGLLLDEYRYVARRSANRIAVAASAAYSLTDILANFSFLFLLLVAVALLVLFGYAGSYRKGTLTLTYSTRIQILLNTAFFLPLLLVVTTWLTLTTRSDAQQQAVTQLATVRQGATSLTSYLVEYGQQRRSLASLVEELDRLAAHTGTEATVFDTTGRLLATSEPLRYETGQRPAYCHAEALPRLAAGLERTALLADRLGTTDYPAAYAGLQTPDGRFLGLLEMPFYGASAALERRQAAVIGSGLSVFAVLFLLLLSVSYFASSSLITPLRLLTQKLRRTSLDKLNEPLEWQSDDEIGVLVREYNRMLVNLSESKQKLSQSEKQAAWREMAKQVTHEIQNPLTPIKLTLQQLQRILPDMALKPSAEERQAGALRAQRTLNSLLAQIDTLSDIATSFTDFANMPLPRNDTFELTTVLNRAADLYADDQKITLTRAIQPGPIRVVGDRQFIGRILTNLIINGIQAVPPGRKPVIDLRLYTTRTDVQIEIRDNGAGIPEAIRPKVFLPNFSTKRGGSGLGLAIAKRGIEHAGGSIWFETADGVGTTFFLTLPLARQGTKKADR